MRAGLLPLLLGSYINVKENEVEVLLRTLRQCLLKSDTDTFIKHMKSFLSSIPYDAHETVRYEWEVKKVEK